MNVLFTHICVFIFTINSELCTQMQAKRNNNNTKRNKTITYHLPLLPLSFCSNHSSRTRIFVDEVELPDLPDLEAYPMLIVHITHENK